MRYAGGVIFALLLGALPAAAQDALVVTTCGTLTQQYAPGSARLPTVDVNGRLCLANSGAGITSLTGDVTATGPGAAAATLVTAQPGAHTWAAVQTFTLAPVFTDASGSRTALGLGTAATQNTGTSGATIPLLNGANTWSGIATFTDQIINTKAGASGTSTVALTGAVFTGGGTTLTKPLLLIEPAGTASSAWSNLGTLYGGNAASGCTGSLLDLQVAAAARFRVACSGAITTNSDLTIGAGGVFSWSGRGKLSSATTGSVQLGDADAASPVAQILRGQSVVAGTSNTAGVNLTVLPGLATGLASSGDLVLQTGGTGTTGTTQNTAIDGIRIKSSDTNANSPSVVLGTAALATTANNGFLYIASGAGTPTGVPTTFTGRVPIYIDTTNSQLWLYLGGAWKQPKTPAAAAIVTWQ